MFRVVSRLDIKSSWVIKGVQFEGLRKVGDPTLLAEQYYKEGIDEILFIDSVASLYGRNHLGELVSRVSKNIFVPMTVGGGIRTLNDAGDLFKLGADKVAINTANFSSRGLIREISNKYGAQAVVGSIQAKRIGSGWECLTEQGREKTNIQVSDWIEQLEKAGAGELLITSVDFDGTKNGFDFDLAKLAAATTNRPVLVGGGAGSLEDFSQIVEVSNLSGVSVATCLHQGTLKIKDIKTEIEKAGIKVRKVPQA
jgi:cyclase